MINTTLCYLENNNKYLMLHRNKKVNDLNEDKWIGVGGKFEKNETPELCVKREVYEETGLKLEKVEYRGLIKFSSNIYETELMHLFWSDSFYGDIKECDEGTLEWINKKDLLKKNLWEGDKIFLNLLDSTNKFFILYLDYEEDVLKKAILNGDIIYEKN